MRDTVWMLLTYVAGWRNREPKEERSMSVSRRLRQRWNDDELIVALDLHLNHDLNDGHNHNAIAKCLGRYSPATSSHNDGPVNQKLAELMGMLKATRAKRHPGTRIVELAQKYRNKHAALRKDAVIAWKNILPEILGPVPPEVRQLLR